MLIIIIIVVVIITSCVIMLSCCFSCVDVDSAVANTIKQLSVSVCSARHTVWVQVTNPADPFVDMSKNFLFIYLFMAFSIVLAGVLVL